jgi:hypothetical protein
MKTVSEQHIKTVILSFQLKGVNSDMILVSHGLRTACPPGSSLEKDPFKVGIDTLSTP